MTYQMTRILKGKPDDMSELTSIITAKGKGLRLVDIIDKKKPFEL